MISLRCYFSFRSPFAAIALYRLRRLNDFADISIELMPVWPEVVFGGHIDNPTDNLFKIAYIFGDAARQAEVAGIDRSYFDAIASNFTLPEEADYKTKKLGIQMPEEHWEGPHKAFLYAQHQGKGWAFADALCIRRFNFDNKGAADIMNPEVLDSLAEEVDLDVSAMRAAIASPEIEDEMQNVIRESEKDGVFGVPFFVLDMDGEIERYWGNDRLEYVLMRINGQRTLPSLPQVSLEVLCRT